MKVNLLLVLLLAVTLTACETRRELLGNLDVREAIEIVVALQKRGIAAEQEKGGTGRDSRYNIYVSADEMPRATNVLSEYGFPRKNDETFDACTRQQGFTPNTPELNNLRLDRALELKIERLLTTFPGVISATTVIRSHLNSSLQTLEAVLEPTASVVIRYYSDTDKPQFEISDVQRVVAQSIPSLSPDKVSVETARSDLSPIDPANTGPELVRLPAFGFRVPREDKVFAGINILTVLILFCIAGLAIGAAWSNWNLRRRALKRARAATGEHQRSLFIEAQLEGTEPGRTKLPPGRAAAGQE